MYLERYVNEGSRSYSEFASHIEGNPKFHPVSATKYFRVPCFFVPLEKISIHLDEPQSFLKDTYIHDGYVKFPIHPEIYKDLSIPFLGEIRKYPCESIYVIPAASTRTVMAKSAPHFIKLHYPRQISRFVRSLEGKKIEGSVEVSKILNNFSCPNFGFLPETIGVTFGKAENSWGYLIRELNPRPNINPAALLMPLFSLYSNDYFEKDDEPLLVQIINYLGVNPAQYVVQKLIEPIITIWCTCIRQTGLFLVMHSENLLIELNPNLSLDRIIYRDLDIDIDEIKRKELNLHTNFCADKLINKDIIKHYSLHYDSTIGHHLFEYLAKMLERYYNINPAIIEKSARDIFRNCFPDAHLYFNNKVYYYTNKILPNNNFELVETGHNPKWR